jgi:hypothetical protein
VIRRVRSDYSLRLTADLNSSYSPAVVARHDAMLDEVAIAAPFRIVAAEAGGVAAHAGASGHHGWLNHADSRQPLTVNRPLRRNQKRRDDTRSLRLRLTNDVRILR